MYQQGNLPKAEIQAEAGYRRFLLASSDWAGQFRILQLRTMLLRAKYAEALNELSKTKPTVFSNCELVARSYLLKSSLYASLGHDSEATINMREAERQCDSPSPLLTADLATIRGIFIDYDAASIETDYLDALAIVREHHDPYRETSLLLNIGALRLDHERYDESIEWTLASLRISQKKVIECTRKRLKEI